MLIAGVEVGGVSLRSVDVLLMWGPSNGFGRRCDVTYLAIARQKTLALWVRWQWKDARRQANFTSRDHGLRLEVDCKCSLPECLDMDPSNTRVRCNPEILLGACRVHLETSSCTVRLYRDYRPNTSYREHTTETRHERL